MTLLGVLLLAFGCWFLYDAVIGYPRGAYKAVAHEAFKAGSEGTWEEYSNNEQTYLAKAKLSDEELATVKSAHAAGGERQSWADFARKNKFDQLTEPEPGAENRALFAAFQAGGKVANLDAVEAAWLSYAGANSLPPDPVAAEDDGAIALKNAFRDASKLRDWALYAAAKDLPSKKPHFHGTSDIIEQYIFGGLCAAAGLVALVRMMLNRNRSVTADSEAYYPKPSVKVPFADVFRIDTRKWRRKGLAYAYHRADGGDERKAVIDDLKFVGSQQILDRMLGKFEGELIEEVIDDEPEDGGDGVADAPEGSDGRHEESESEGGKTA